MILTGKAREDFIDYLWQSKFKKDDYKEYEYYINNQKESHTYADIIDWFDSVGIYVNVLRYGLSEPNKWVVVKSLCKNNLDFIYSSRQEAIKQAIIKANEIYNERNII